MLSLSVLFEVLFMILHVVPSVNYNSCLVEFAGRNFPQVILHNFNTLVSERLGIVASN